MNEELWTGLCTSCGDVWEERARPVICPECEFRGVVAMPSDSPQATELRRRNDYTERG